MSADESAAPARGPGRPPAEEPRDQTLRIRVTKTELEAVKEAAAGAGTNPSDWARTKLIAAAKRTKPKASTETVSEAGVVALPDGAGNVRHRVVEPGDVIVHTEMPGDITGVTE